MLHSCSSCFDLLQKLYAKAIYNNDADSSDELAFKKGDILTVIEQDTEGIEGWWLCSLHNRQVSGEDEEGEEEEGVEEEGSLAGEKVNSSSL